MKTYILLFPIILTGIYSCNKSDTNTTTTSPTTTKVMDIDGNAYDTIKVGTQVWLAENLKTTHYQNGGSIANLTDNTQWSNNNTGAYCSYDNDSINSVNYGYLYNWYAVNNPAGLCPAGWHIPTDSEWIVLINNLGGEDLAGGAMKATSFWSAPNAGATNSSGFIGLPSSFRDVDGMFNYLNYDAYFWSSTAGSSYYVWSCQLSYDSKAVSENYYGKKCGFSIRCIKDQNNSSSF